MICEFIATVKCRWLMVAARGSRRPPYWKSLARKKGGKNTNRWWQYEVRFFGLLSFIHFHMSVKLWLHHDNKDWISCARNIHLDNNCFILYSDIFYLQVSLLKNNICAQIHLGKHGRVCLVPNIFSVIHLRIPRSGDLDGIPPPSSPQGDPEVNPLFLGEVPLEPKFSLVSNILS